MYRKLIIITILLSGMSFGQQRWEKIYSNGEGRSILQVLDGGYIITGYRRGDVLLMKINVLGDSVWANSFGGEFGDIGYYVQKTRDNGYIIVGQLGSGTTPDIYLIKVDSLGNSLWAETYGGPARDVGYSVQQTGDNGYIIVGNTLSFGVGGGDIYVTRTDSLGDTLWTKTYGGPYWDAGYSVQIAADNGYVIAGWRSDAPSTRFVYLLKTDAWGDSIWARRYGQGYGYSVAKTSDGGYIVTGGVLRGTYTDVYLVRTDSNGDSIWSKTYDGPRGFDDAGYSVQQTTDGGFIITGEAGVFPDPRQCDVYLIKTNDRGETTWTRTWHRSGALENVGYSVQQTSDGGYIIAGRTGGGASEQLYLIKTDAQGNSDVEEGYLLSAHQYRRPDIDLQIRTPCRSQLHLWYFTSKRRAVTIELFDVSGRKVGTYYSGYSSSGTNSLTRSLSLPSGVYFVCLKSGADIMTKKVVILE